MAGVVAFINLAAFTAAAEQVLDAEGVAVAGGALEAIDVEAQNLPLLAELLGDCVGVLLRSFSLRLGGAFDVDAMLVGAGGQDGVEALHVFQRPDGVGRDGRVGVADVGGGVGVVDRGGQVVFVHLIYLAEHVPSLTVGVRFPGDTSILAGVGAVRQTGPE